MPVLLDEALALLQVRSGGEAVDATLGGGGYTERLLKAVGPKGRVLSVDLDSDALEHAAARYGRDIKSGRLVLAHGNFRDVDEITERHGFTNVSGIVADIGLSSYQLDQSGSGMSFSRDELLDMRFDRRGEAPDARFLLSSRSERELSDIFKRFGEEPLSGRIASAVVRARAERELRRTSELCEIIRQAVPKDRRHRWADVARRVFQALRIAVNHELDNLTEFLGKAFDLLAPNGRLAVVTFHSLEDRIVKHHFQGLTRGCVCPPDFPACVCGKTPKARLLTKKPVTASPRELQENSRSKPAKLRAVEKL